MSIENSMIDPAVPPTSLRIRPRGPVGLSQHVLPKTGPRAQQAVLAIFAPESELTNLWCWMASPPTMRHRELLL